MVDVHVADVLACSIERWYPRLKGCALRARYTALAPSIVAYLHADGVVLPADGGDGDEDDEATVMLARDEEYQRLRAWMLATIDEYGGAVMPKLNWSAPKDAVWVATGSTLKCQTTDDVWLLLKSSDHIAYDLSYPFATCADAGSAAASAAAATMGYQLVLKEWFDIPASAEFRCFVKHNTLVGVSQRDHSNFYEFLAAQQEEILQRIVRFFVANLHGKPLQLTNYVFDVVLTKTLRTVKLVDINPFGTMTEPLLFQWSELYDMVVDAEVQTATSEQGQLSDQDVRELAAMVDFRIVLSQEGIRPLSTQSSRLPKDVYDLAVGGDNPGLEALLAQMQAQNASDAIDNDDE